MIIYYDVAGDELARLAETIGDCLGYGVFSCGAPTYGYQIDKYFVSRCGDLHIWDRAYGDEVENLLDTLEKAGFTARPDHPVPGDEDYEYTLEHGGVIRIYWNDISPAKQEEILEAYGSNCNYDVFPIVEIPIIDEGGGDE